MTDEPRCKATNARGQQCKRRPILGGTVCATHGGSAPQVKAKAQQRIAEAKLKAEVEAYRAEIGLADEVDTSPLEAMLRLVRTEAATVAYLERKAVEFELDHDGLVKDGPFGPFVSAEYQMLAKARERLANVCALALRNGVEERLVRIASLQASDVLDLLGSVLDRLGLSDEQRGLVPDAVAAAIGGRS